MVKRLDAAADGMYHVGGAKYDKLVGSRAEVMHGKAMKTKGGLKKMHLMYKDGRIKSRKASANAKKSGHLKKFLQPKGSRSFGPKTKKAMRVRKAKRSKKATSRKAKKSKKAKRSKK